jgi:D-lactate dehydrogenase
VLAPDARLVADLGRALAPARVLARPIDRLARSVDASIYRLIPEAVVRPTDLAEMKALLECARAHARSLTFRTAGTSLSGQAVTDSILVELGPHWKACRVLDEGRRVWFQPGVIGGYLNRLLAPHGYRIGPDPASIDAAMMGGILANNSSGMCCGTEQNAYRTLESMAFMLADGTLVDTSRPDADGALRRARPDLHEALAACRDEVRGDPELSVQIRRRFARKNTMGYRLDAFLDHMPPVDILARLMIGSQGTLGYIAEATLRTVPEPPARAAALVYFAALTDAGAAVTPLAAAGAAALEIMDTKALRSMSQAEPDAHPIAIEDDTAALLVEFREAEPAALDVALERAGRALSAFALRAPASFTAEASERERLWRLRKGILATTGALRPSGTAVVIEDVVIPVEQLAAGIADLQALFATHGYREASIVGHAKDGNLHFLLAEDFGRPESVSNYARFMQSLAALIVGRYDGALKAEHGSGRNMAPFVELEWGTRAYELMRRIKRLLDSDGLLNPGVLLNSDPEIHLRNLKPLPSISPLADKCIECGFCEPRCPSRDLTLSPRQRIVAVREMARLGGLGGADARAARASLAADFAYEGTATCVGDSMCQTSCPVKIDTGALMKELQAAARPAWSRRSAGFAARRFGVAASLARAGLRGATLLRSLPGGTALLGATTAGLNRLAPALVPLVTRGRALPAAAKRLPRPRSAGAAQERRVVYFPSCLTRVVGALPGEPPARPAHALLELLEAAGFPVVYPRGIGGLCCGMPFASRAHPDAARIASRAALEALSHAARGGRDPVVTDASPCAGSLRDAALGAREPSTAALRVYDFASFWAAEGLRAKPPTRRRPGVAVLHPTCTLVKAGGLPDLLSVARACAESVFVPPGTECCGFAGDRGFLIPELTVRATAREASEVAAVSDASGFYSTCRTCEIGMTRAVGRPYLSLVELVRDATLGA